MAIAGFQIPCASYRNPYDETYEERAENRD